MFLQSTAFHWLHCCFLKFSLAWNIWLYWLVMLSCLALVSTLEITTRISVETTQLFTLPALIFTAWKLTTCLTYLICTHWARWLSTTVATELLLSPLYPVCCTYITYLHQRTYDSFCCSAISNHVYLVYFSKKNLNFRVFCKDIFLYITISTLFSISNFYGADGWEWTCNVLGYETALYLIQNDIHFLYNERKKKVHS